MKLGRFDLSSLSDGTFRLDGGAMVGVIPKPLWERRIPADDRNRITLGLRPLLVRTDREAILIDGGVGDQMSPKDAEIYALDRTRHLDHSLAAVGLTAHGIDLVIATHLHFDHVGGFTTRVDGVWRPRFPRARYVINRHEWHDATHPHERNRASYVLDTFMPLLDAGVVDFVDHDTDVRPGLRLERTGGHTMHHDIVRIESEGRTALYVADLMPTTAHVDEPWIMGYDLYPVDTLVAKKRVLAEAIAGEYVIFFEHDPATAAGVIRLDGRRKRIEPIEPIG
jgi:glyoxylase-like metal-dependent hydrolase (beta-lactamase superfamily II)